MKSLTSTNSPMRVTWRTLKTWREINVIALFGVIFVTLPLHNGSVTNITPNKAMTLISLQVFKVLQVTRIGEFVEVKDFIIRILPQNVLNKVRTDESRTACD